MMTQKENNLKLDQNVDNKYFTILW